MSGRDQLREYENEQHNGSVIEDTPEGMRSQLTELLALKQIGLEVISATVFGSGNAASVDLHLSHGAKVTFERFADIAKPAALSAHLVTNLGLVRTFKTMEAMLVGALIHRLAEHRSDQGADETAREWATEFLRFAPTQEVNLDDQAERWRAFSSIAPLDPLRDATDERSACALACASVVLVDPGSGVRLVRCGWFLSYVRRHVGGLYTPTTLGTQMARVGWERRGTEGWIKATCPTDERFLRWRFYIVPKGWEDAE
jgi:hypothetical protein